MRIGVDSSVLIAALHANHPLHPVAVGWMIAALRKHELIVAAHSVLECYAVLTRLPGKWRVSGEEAHRLICETIRPNMAVAGCSGKSLWDALDRMAEKRVVGGQTYDAWTSRTLSLAGADVVATFNPSHFLSVADDMVVVDPSKPGQNTALREE